MDFERQLFEENCVYIEDSLAALMRAVHFLKGLYLIDHIMVQARLAKILLMLAIAHVNFEVFVF